MMPTPTSPREGWTRLYWEAASILARRHPRPASLETASRVLHQLAQAPGMPPAVADAARRTLLRHYGASPAAAGEGRALP